MLSTGQNRQSEHIPHSDLTDLSLSFSLSLWYLTNICGLRDLVIPPQWAPFGFGPLVASFGVYAHT